MKPSVHIAGQRVGPDADDVLIVAELSGNHLGSYENAEQLVLAAKQAGADAVKLQTYTADTLTLDVDSPVFRVGQGTLWSGRKLHDLYREASTPWTWHAPLQQRAHELGLIFFSTPFDPTAVELLASLDVPAYKIASFELVDLPLLDVIGRQGKPVILSTGMASLDEIDEAVATLEHAGCDELVLLKCTSAYPALAQEMNLRAMTTLAERYRVPVGLSDHTRNSTAAIAAVALGATLIEKHLTLDRRAGGPDAPFSLEPSEFAELVLLIRQTSASLGTSAITCGLEESKSRDFRRSLFVVEEMHSGELFTPQNVRSIRPGHGLEPKHLGTILGRRARCAIQRGTPLAWELVGDA